MIGPKFYPMRHLCTLALILVLGAAAWAQQPAPPPMPSNAQVDKVRDLLQRYGPRLLVLNRQRQLLARIGEIVTPEQQEVLSKIHLTPEQGARLLRLLQDSLPEALLNHDVSPQSLQKRLGPQVVEILGPEQIDLILQLQPSPQQVARVQEILQGIGENWQHGVSLDPVAVKQLTSEVGANLTPEQRRWLEFFMGLIKK